MTKKDKPENTDQSEVEPHRGPGRPRKVPQPYPGSAFAQGKDRVEEIALDEIDLEDMTFELRVSLKPELLVDSLKSHGVQVPVIVRKHPRKKETYQLVCGFRRTAAAKLAGLTAIPAIVRDLDDEQAHVLAYAENEFRKTLNDLDRANGIAKLRKAGRKQEEVAQFYRLTDRQVRRLEELLEYPDVIKKVIDDDKSGVTTTHATVLMQAARKFGGRFDVGRWVGNLRRQKWSVDHLRGAIAEQLGSGRQKRRGLVRRSGSRISFDLKAIETAADAQRKDALERLRAIVKEIGR